MTLPSEVIDQVKQMALRLKRGIGITFTDKDININNDKI